MPEVVPPKSETTIMLRNVRLSFPELFVATQYEGKGPFNYAATFLVTPGSENDKTIRNAIAKAAFNKWAAKAEAAMKTIEGQSQKYCYLDGATKDYSGYEGMWALSCKRKATDGPPKVIDRAKREIAATEGIPYGGCYVNAKVDIWAQDNDFGKGMRCTIITVQFLADGESFGGAPRATDDGFETIEETAEDLV